MTLGSTQPHIQGTGALSQGVKQSESEAESSSPSRAEIGMCGEIPPLPYILMACLIKPQGQI
jgi:hypothetical protein